MVRRCAGRLGLLLIAMMLSQAGCATVKLTRAEEANWICYTVPLPKSITITDKVVAPKGSVLVKVESGSGIVVDQAVKELYEALGGEPKGQPSVTIKLEIGGPRAERLKNYRNSEQAYIIYPAQDGKELTVSALDPAGLYYGAKTIVQLVRGHASADKVDVPMLSVLDWPDMQDRGLWGSDNFDHVAWMADRKMNWIEQISRHGVDENGQTFGSIKDGREPMITEGPQRAVKPIPVVLHLEQSGGSAVKAYPEIQAKAERKGLMCYSKPKTVEIIAGWIMNLTRYPEVHEVDVWMTENLENRPGCQCDDCKKTGVNPIVLEARAIVKAWEMAQEKSGKKLGLRVLTSETTEDYNQQIFAELPEEAKLVYYHSLLTYTCGKRPMLRKYLADYAKSGHWLGVCPNIGVVPHYTEPFTSAAFVHYRMKEFVDKGVQGLLGYTVPRVHFARFNTEASAEWGWNVNGRSTKQFAYSWAVRQGLKDPAKFAEYSECVGPVLFDVYGSDWPSRAGYSVCGTVVEQLKKDKLPDLGFVLWDFIYQPFGSITSMDEMNRDVMLADKAVKLARQMGIEEFVQESMIAQGYIRSLKALYEIRGYVKANTVTPGNMAAATRSFQAFADSLRQACDALPKWEKVTARPTDPAGFTQKSVNILHEAAIDPMIEYGKQMGLRVK